MPKSKGRRKPKQRTQPAKPAPQKHKESPIWYVATMFGVMAIGALVVIVNYIGVFGGSMDNNYLYAGLALIGVGFVMTLNYH